MNAILWMLAYLAVGIVIAQFALRVSPREKSKVESFATVAVLIWPLAVAVFLCYAAGNIAVLLAGKKGVRE